MLDGGSRSWRTRLNNGHSVVGLLKDLGTIARRDVLKLSMDDFQTNYMKELINEVSRPMVGSRSKNTNVIRSALFLPLLSFINWALWRIFFKYFWTISV
jgi:hypothetical protein